MHVLGAFLVLSLAPIGLAVSLNDLLTQFSFANANGFTVATFANQLNAAPSSQSVIGSFGPVTVLAPMDAAFLAAGNGALAIVPYHLVSPMMFDPNRSIMSRTFLNTTFVDPLSPQKFPASIRVDITAGAGVTPGMTIMSGMREASNGVLHIIDKLLTPPPSVPAAATNLGATSWISALTSTGIMRYIKAGTLGQMTYLLPTNAAMTSFDAKMAAMGVNVTTTLMTQILLCNMVAGFFTSDMLSFIGNASLQSAYPGFRPNVTSTPAMQYTMASPGGNAALSQLDVIMLGGIAHVTDNVLIPEMSFINSSFFLANFIGFLPDGTAVTPTVTGAAAAASPTAGVTSAGPLSAPLGASGGDGAMDATGGVTANDTAAGAGVGMLAAGGSVFPGDPNKIVCE
ncbi:hypothetical protein HK101_010093 [Irineochytrium annulatum]|nr:hypothetical protein HK101_010093 [Irineochytrium annulatum]